MIGLNEIKKHLRLTTNAHDAEINGLIAACIRDLQNVGIDTSANTMSLTPYDPPPAPGDPPAAGGDPLINRAIVLYCKAGFGAGSSGRGTKSDQERYMESYESLKTKLALSGDYIQRANDGDEDGG